MSFASLVVNQQALEKQGDVELAQFFTGRFQTRDNDLLTHDALTSTGFILVGQEGKVMKELSIEVTSNGQGQAGRVVKAAAQIIEKRLKDAGLEGIFWVMASQSRNPKDFRRSVDINYLPTKEDLTDKQMLSLANFRLALPSPQHQRLSLI